MKRVRDRGQLPSSADIVRETFERLGYLEGAIYPDEVVQRFNELLRNLWEKTLPTLEKYEERSYSEGIPREFIQEYPDIFNRADQISREKNFREAIMRLFSEWYPMLRRAFLSVSQSRMTRGGKDFELQIEGLFTLAGIPYHKQKIENRTDLILPDIETHRRNRNLSAIVSVKRTLRERWAEVAEELFNLRSPNVFLFTADENVSTNHVTRICGQYNIHLVLWDAVKAKKFPHTPMVLSYSEWATQRLAVLRQNWDT
jgi:hypothetical protein